MTERGLILAVSGTRRMLNEEEEARVVSVLEPLLERARVVHVGDCPTGVDWIVRGHARPNRLKVHQAYWDEEGHRAGPNRNKRMLEEAAGQAERTGLDVLLAAFPNGFTWNHSPGTYGAMRIAHEMKIDVITTELM